MKKVTLKLTVKVLINADDDADIETVVNEFDYTISDTTTKADVIDTEITDMTIEDSR